MNTLHISIALLFLSNSIASAPIKEGLHSTTVPGIQVAEPAPVEGVFDKDLISGYLKNADCVGVRFYTVLKTTEPSSTSVVAIPVDKDGKEISKWIQTTPYRMYTSLSGTSAGVDKLSASKASEACIRYTTAGGGCFAATVSRSDVQALLDTGCGAVQLTVEGSKFQMTAVNIAGGKVQALGTGPTYQRLSGEPCPVACGADPSVFLRMR